MRYTLAQEHEHFCLGCKKRWYCRSPQGCESRWRYICLECLQKQVDKTRKLNERQEQGQ